MRELPAGEMEAAGKRGCAGRERENQLFWEIFPQNSKFSPILTQNEYFL